MGILNIRGASLTNVCRFMALSQTDDARKARDP
jgi:hypothetical protein